MSLISTFESEKEVVILKARQLGISWLVCAFCLWKCLFHENVKVLFLSQGEDEAWDLVSKCRYIWSSLPDFMRISIGHDTKAGIDFPVIGSEIKALPSTAKAGRSTDATIVVRDELEFHPYAAENFSAISPTIDAGGLLIDLSTQDKNVADSHFQERYTRAMNGENGAKFVFLGAELRPTREEGLEFEEWWNLRIIPKYTEWQIENEYPRTLDDALSAPRTRGFFDGDALNDMEQDIQNPITVDDINTHGGMVKLYKMPVVGRRYCVFTDPSDGKDDPHAIVVMDTQSGDGVAESNGKTTADICGRIHDELVRFYNNAYNTNEVNASPGGKCDDTIRDLQTPNRAPFMTPDGKPMLDKDGLVRKYGWWTSPQLKRKMLWGFEEAVRTRMVRIHTKYTLTEFRNFIVPVGDDPQAKRGWHDDTIMAWAGVWQLSKSAPMLHGEVKSYRPRTRS